VTGFLGAAVVFLGDWCYYFGDALFDIFASLRCVSSDSYYCVASYDNCLEIDKDGIPDVPLGAAATAPFRF